MSYNICFIGFGEAARAFAWPGARAYDRKSLSGATRGEMADAIAAAEVAGFDEVAEALAGATAVFSLVTADEAFDAARAYAPLLDPGTLWFDCNSISPDAKRRCAAIVEAAEGRYVDVAVMAPVLPARRNVPLLTSGPHSAIAAALLSEFGFRHVASVGTEVGDAASIKMIRSVMVKGLEALTAECILAAERAGVADAVLASLDSTWREHSWANRADYNLARMLQHGQRRAAEMEEVVVTLEELGIDPVMTRGTIARQKLLGSLGIAPPAGLGAKLSAIQLKQKDAAA